MRISDWSSDVCSSDLWGTYRQWQDQGAQVRTGEKLSLVIFYKDYAPVEATASEDDPERSFVDRASRVFNVSKVEGYVSLEEETSVNITNPSQAAEALLVEARLEERRVQSEWLRPVRFGWYRYP